MVGVKSTLEGRSFQRASAACSGQGGLIVEPREEDEIEEIEEIEEGDWVVRNVEMSVRCVIGERGRLVQVLRRKGSTDRTARRRGVWNL